MTWLAFLPALLEVLRNYTGVHADLASALLLSVTPDVLLAQASTIVDEKNIVIGEKDAEIQELKHTLTSVTKGFKKQISDLAGSTASPRKKAKLSPKAETSAGHETQTIKYSCLCDTCNLYAAAGHSVYCVDPSIF